LKKAAENFISQEVYYSFTFLIISDLVLSIKRLVPAVRSRSGAKGSGEKIFISL